MKNVEYRDKLELCTFLTDELGTGVHNPDKPQSGIHEDVGIL